MDKSLIKANLPHMVIWMAKTAVKEGVKAYHESQRLQSIENQKKEAGEEFNYLTAHAYTEGMNIAAEILWKLFSSCSADCQEAIKRVADVRDGHKGWPEEYFDLFIGALESVQGHPIRIRLAE